MYELGLHKHLQPFVNFSIQVDLSKQDTEKVSPRSHRIPRDLFRSQRFFYIAVCA